MMQISFETDPGKFLEKYGPQLERNEAEHNLILSLSLMAEQRIAKGEKVEIRFATLSNDDGLVLASLQTPPGNLILSRATEPEIEELAEKLAGENYTLPGIVGPSDVAASFTNKWTEKTGQQSVEYMDQIIYSLKNVIPPPPIEGTLRPAKEGEESIIQQWIMNFAKDALPRSEHLTPEEALKRATDLIKAQRMYVWDVGGKPRAQAGLSGTPKAARLNMVYTPPEERGNGYASAVVAGLSQLQIEQGKKMCCLYADARNSVSNSIYRKIGYEFVGRSSLYVLARK